MKNKEEENPAGVFFLGYYYHYYYTHFTFQIFSFVFRLFNDALQKPVELFVLLLITFNTSDTFVQFSTFSHDAELKRSLHANDRANTAGRSAGGTLCSAHVLEESSERWSRGSSYIHF